MFLTLKTQNSHLQRQQRLADAKQVEAKAARIKDWVTNKLKELEEQNNASQNEVYRIKDLTVTEDDDGVGDQLDGYNDILKV